MAQKRIPVKQKLTPDLTMNQARAVGVSRGREDRNKCG